MATRMRLVYYVFERDMVLDDDLLVYFFLKEKIILITIIISRRLCCLVELATTRLAGGIFWAVSIRSCS